LVANQEPVCLFDSSCTTLPKDSYSVILKGSLALRVYPDTRPHNMKIAQIQKGLVLVLNERELIEEGAGFGVPVAIFSDRTCFSGSAETLIMDNVQSKIVIKRYRIDTVSKKGWKNTVLPEIPILKFISNRLENAYRKNQFIRKFFFPSVNIRKKIGVKMIYKRIKSRGEIVVTYNINENSIIINADFRGLNRNCLKKIVLLNEQGSTFFRKFSSNGSILVDEQIGGWRLLTANQACFSNLEGSLGFCFRNLSNCRSFIGREYLNEFLSWVGLEYETSPDQDFLEYEIKIIRNDEL
jgi:hypothetical protein